MQRFAISLDAELARQVRKAAAGEPTSTWLADAARSKLRAQGLLEVVHDWEATHGEITLAELQAAERRQRPAKKRR
ncbi:MAG: hypothetical protein IPL61_03260 [Myxococcales bacterium]|nr:hypothetical protein [Myxococcales bacterium]